MTLTEQRAWLDADGKGLTVLTGPRTVRLWRYRDGTWKDFDWPKNVSQSTVAKAGEYFYQRSSTLPATPGGVDTAELLRKGQQPPYPVIRIGLDGATVTLDPQETLTVGPFRFSLGASMANDYDGTFYAVCQEAYQETQKLGPGVVVCDREGRAVTSPQARSRR